MKLSNMINIYMTINDYDKKFCILSLFLFNFILLKEIKQLH